MPTLQLGNFAFLKVERYKADVAGEIVVFDDTGVIFINHKITFNIDRIVVALFFA